MNSQKVQSWIQIIGMVTVVGSLVFVGLQLKQSQEIAIAAQYQARLEAANSHYTSILQSEAGLTAMGNDILTDTLANPDTPDAIKAWISSQPVEQLAFRAVGAIMYLKSHDNAHFQYQSGFLSEEAWKALREQLKVGLADPRTWVRSVYEENPAVWRESYQKLVEELILELETAS